jgi:hypothetical protein
MGLSDDLDRAIIKVAPFPHSGDGKVLQDAGSLPALQFFSIGLESNYRYI